MCACLGAAQKQSKFLGLGGGTRLPPTPDPGGTVVPGVRERSGCMCCSVPIRSVPSGGMDVVHARAGCGGCLGLDVLPNACDRSGYRHLTAAFPTTPGYRPTLDSSVALTLFSSG